MKKYIDNWVMLHIDALVQERRNSSALAMELRLFCTYPSTLPIVIQIWKKLNQVGQGDYEGAQFDWDFNMDK